MTNCPYCGQELQLADNAAFTNADIYHITNRVLTTCCDQFVLVIPKRSYEIRPSHTRIHIDDWGNKKVTPLWIKGTK